MIMMKTLLQISVCVTLALWAANLPGFEVETHRLLSERATDSSQLNSYLTTVLGFEFPSGTGEEVGQGLTVRQLIARVGAVNEDKPDIRSRNHFHDPTKAWAEAGLTSPFTPTYESSVLWSQNPNQGSGGKHSWQDARNSYFNALTATDPADRKRYYAETFESLGHLIHLIQDAATPGHTRNDWHLGLTTGNKLFPFLNVDRFHQWARTSGERAINSAGSLPFDPSILNQTYNNLVPIAGIIDTTTSAGDATPSEGTNIGIAEFSNANFFSDDTILKDYAYPNTTQLDLTEEAGPDGPETRFYLRKSFGPGPIGYRAAVSSRLSGFLPFGFATQQWELDDNVMSDYGALLFPRAIGYSAGLIDYFFRGIVSEDFRFETVVEIPYDQRPNSVGLLDVAISNSSGNESVGTGTIRVVLIKDSVYTSGYSPPPITETFPDIIVSNPVSIAGNPIPSTLSVSFDSLPFPTAANLDECFCAQSTDYLAFLVFEGTLGQEIDNAVVVGGHCNGIYPRHLIFVHSYWDLVDGNELGILGWC